MEFSESTRQNFAVPRRAYSRSATCLPNRIFTIFYRELTANCAKHSGVGGEPAVPIRLLLEHDHAFSPEDVKVLIGAFEDTLRSLNLVDREDQLTMTVAKLIIQFAKEDERDPVRLRQLVLNTLRPP